MIFDFSGGRLRHFRTRLSFVSLRKISMSNFTWAVRPVGLELVLYRFIEHQSGDAFLQGADDEVFINGVAFDTTELTTELTLPTHPINLPAGDVSHPAVNASWISNTSPFVVYRFDLRNSDVFPRTCTVQLQVVEEDSEDVNETFKKIDEKYRAKLSEAVTKLGADALAVLGDAVAKGSGPVIREVSSTILQQLVPVAFGALADAISSGLGNDVFMPAPFTMLIPHNNYDFNDTNPANRVYGERPPEWCMTDLLSNHISTGSEHYEFVYYWKLEREILQYRDPSVFVKPKPFKFPTNLGTSPIRVHP
jgi:hypothetical protein